MTDEEKKKRTREYDRKRYADNPEKKRAASYKWRMANYEKVRAAEKKHYAVNREKILADTKKRRADNPEKRRSISLKWRTNNPQRIRSARLKYKYGLTVEQHAEIFNRQNGRCAVCGTHQNDLKKGLVVDHEHSTGRVRGLLCQPCNIGIGHLCDDPMRLRKAAMYLTIPDNYAAELLFPKR